MQEKIDLPFRWKKKSKFMSKCTLLSVSLEILVPILCKPISFTILLFMVLQTEAVIKKHEAQLKEMRYHFNMGIIMGQFSTTFINLCHECKC